MKKKRKQNKLILFFVSIFVGLLGLFSIPVNAASEDDNHIHDNMTPELYDKIQEKADVKYWTKYDKYEWYEQAGDFVGDAFAIGVMGGIFSPVYVNLGGTAFTNHDRTYSYIRITKENSDELIKDVKYIDTSYYYNGKLQKLAGEVNEVFPDYKKFTRTELGGYKHTDYKGLLYEMPNYINEENKGLKFTDENGKKSLYQECNYLWYWGGKVTDIVYLNVWYEVEVIVNGEVTKELVGASFSPNGEHPRYNEDGSFKGIYNTEGVLLENYTLNTEGIPSEIKADGTLVPVISVSDQKVGETTIETNFFDGLLGDSTIDKVVSTVKIIFILIITIAILIFAIWIIKKITCFVRWVRK